MSAGNNYCNKFIYHYNKNQKGIAHNVTYADIKGMKNKPQIVVPAKKYDKTQLTLKSCSIEIYEESDDYNSQEVITSIKDYCSKNGAQYAIMRHDKDYFSEDTFNSSRELVGHKGEKKRTHYHCLISFKNRVCLNDICLKFGIEDRWVKILKHDKDFDNMSIYCTHIKYDEAIKTHYPVSDFDTNIGEYIQHLYDSYIASCDDSNIITDAISLVNTNPDIKFTYQLFITSLLDMGYALNELRQYYLMLKDLRCEHNVKIEMSDTLDHALTAARAETADRTNLKLDEVDITGFATINRGDDSYTIVKNERKKRK